MDKISDNDVVECVVALIESFVAETGHTPDAILLGRDLIDALACGQGASDADVKLLEAVLRDLGHGHIPCLQHTLDRRFIGAVVEYDCVARGGGVSEVGATTVDD